MGATLSPDGQFRYRLWRDLPATLLTQPRTMLFVMLNPSTADAEADDPTIRRCIGFAQREGYTRIEVVNLLPYRATDPDDMLAWLQVATAEDLAEMQRENNEAILTAFSAADVVVAAWGASAGMTAALFVPNIHEASKLLDKPLFCLGVTDAGHPRHPLYVKGNAPLMPWRPR